MADNVNEPAHYTNAGIECIEAIEAALGADGFRAYCVGNVIKYNWRYRLKNGGEDLRKAEVYAGWAAAGTASRRPEAKLCDAAKLQAAKIAYDMAADDDEPALKAGEAYREHGA